MAPLWSVMSGQDLTLKQCRQGLEYFAITVRTAVRPEDFRQHTFSSSSIRAKIVYMRAATEGSLPAIDDRRCAPVYHGPIW